MHLHASSTAGRVSRPTALGRLRPFGSVLLAVAAMGCYTYNYVPRTQASPGREVQVDLNEVGRTALTQQLGPQVRTVTGRLDATDSTGLTVAISKTTVMNGDDNGWHGEHVRIPYPYIAETGERALSKPKTVAILALAVGAMSGLGLLVGKAVAPSSVGAGTPSSSK